MELQVVDKLFGQVMNITIIVQNCSCKYGNVINSRGSVIPFFKSFHKNQKIPITHTEMTRFMITLKDAVELVFLTYKNMFGGEIFVRKCPSIKLVDIAKAINKNAKFKIIGIRPGEKIHEEMINLNDARNTFEFKNYFKILPELSKNNYNKMKKLGKKVGKILDTHRTLTING